MCLKIKLCNRQVRLSYLIPKYMLYRVQYENHPACCPNPSQNDSPKQNTERLPTRDMPFAPFNALSSSCKRTPIGPVDSHSIYITTRPTAPTIRTS